MSTVYITNYNLKKITSTIDKKIDDELINELMPVIDELRCIFSSIELSRLYLIDDIINNDGEMLIKCFNKNKKTELEGSAYHTSAHCKELNKNYLSVIWSGGNRSEIKKLERDLCKFYDAILYAELNDSSIDLVVPDELKDKYQAYDAKVTIFKNSGHLPFANLSKDEIIQYIKLVLLEADKFRCSSEAIKEEVERYTYGTDRWGTIKNSPIMRDWKSYKDRVAELIIAYFRVSSEKDISYDFLQSLNLKKCKSCSESPFSKGSSENPFSKGSSENPFSKSSSESPFSKKRKSFSESPFSKKR